MPHSTPIFKNETIEFVKSRFNQESHVLDFGAGAGTYSDLLRDHISTIDGVEAFEPYLKMFDLENKYDNIYVNDATSFEFEYYDLITVGDILEHIAEEPAQEFIQNIYSKCKELIVAIPFHSEQGVHYDNTYEIHLQPELTHKSYMEKFPGFRPLCLRYDYGVYVKDTPENSQLPIVLEESTLGTFIPEFIDTFKPALMSEFPGVEIIPYENIVLQEYRSKLRNEPIAVQATEEATDLTIVSGLWDIGRPGRDFKTYLDHFEAFLKIDQNMILFLPEELHEFVFERRSKKNTVVRKFELEDIKKLYEPFWNNTQNIRKSEKWQSLAGWLKDSPQCALEWYNPIVLSKYSLLHAAACGNEFNTDHLIWLDAGITMTCNEGFFTKEFFDNLIPYLDTNLFLSYPYEAEKEIHGFEYAAMNRLAGESVKYVCRGGLFGGHKEYIMQGNGTYWHLVNNTLNQGLMGTEESIFTIMACLEPHIYKRYSLDSNGLIVKFVNDLKDNKNIQLEKITGSITAPKATVSDISKINTSLYFLTFNYPDQLETTIKTLQNHEDFLAHPSNKYIIDNSTNQEAVDGNKAICDKYGFTHLPQQKNTGICGGRQFAAEHFDQGEDDFYLFFEDDMTISDPEEGSCRNGFQKYVPNLYKKLHQIMLKEEFDFLKLSYTEVYMDNNIQVSWYNVPQNVRQRDWPDYNKLPVTGLDPNCPRTKFERIEVHDGLSYIIGNIYYANWPHITSREGNKKMFINTKWARPYEQTWMSHIYQETLAGNIKSAVLLASPVTHERFKYYKPEERIES